MHYTKTMQIRRTKIDKIIGTLTSASIVFWLMPPIMLLLIAGTMAQRWMGLYQSIDKIFASFIIWFPIGAINLPLPGGFTLLALLSLHLALKFLFKSQWSWRKSGIILAHLGALILLIGGLLTAMLARETYMLIPEGQETPYIYHYTNRNLSIFENGYERLRLPYHTRKKWQNSKEYQSLPFQIEILESYNNATIKHRKDDPDFNENTQYQSMAAFMDLQEQPEALEPEANMTGLELTLSGTNVDGRYVAFDGMPKPIEFKSGGKNYTLIFGKEQFTLPFSIRLTDFVKHTYAGTNMAKNYHSDIIVKDGDIEWPVRIEMNEPLRYKGYTFFQSSFDDTGEIEMTILAVVENSGWLIPYIGTGILGLGLLLHTLITIRQGGKK
ncbi:MAG: cytochrome c biogenesis protein ResB [Alphaproteobacteria bacterium]